jgi:hypothetical protein
MRFCVSRLLAPTLYERDCRYDCRSRLPRSQQQLPAALLGLPIVCLDLGLAITAAAALPAGGLAVAVVLDEALPALAPLLLLTGVALGGGHVGAAGGAGGGGGGAGATAPAGLGAIASRGEPGFVALAPVCRQKAKGTWRVTSGMQDR